MTDLTQTISGLLKENSAVRILIESLLKGGALTGSLTLVQQVRGKVRVALGESLIQTLVFATVLFFIDYVLPRLFPKAPAFQPSKETE